MNKNCAGKLFVKANFGADGVLKCTCDLKELLSGQLMLCEQQKASHQIDLCFWNYSL